MTLRRTVLLPGLPEMRLPRQRRGNGPKPVQAQRDGKIYETINRSRPEEGGPETEKDGRESGEGRPAGHRARCGHPDVANQFQQV